MAAKKAEQALVSRWRSILVRHALVQCELDRALHGHGLCGSDFEGLDVLAGSPDEDGRGSRGYRVQRISERVHLSRSALSRLVARPAREGLAERAMCPEDRRGVRVALTPEGRTRHGAALTVRRAVLHRLLSG
ncbi:MarR family transcriptional regulator [Streptomyces sp. NPDC005549]|uniref:MarR family winged helix-turn-helix transcriptional regulator n=1 Tax=Streptomyces sp. NPDC005549 TaxID=3154888 RepID=UPI0033AC62D6